MINQLIVDVPLSRKLDVQFWRFLLPLLAISLVSWSVLGVGDAFGQLLLCSGLLLGIDDQPDSDVTAIAVDG